MKIKGILAPILSAIAIVLGGYALFNLAFMTLGLIADLSTANYPLYLGYLAFCAIGAVILKLVLSQDMFKHTLIATLITLPLMAIVIFIGISTYQQPKYVTIGLGALVIILALAISYFKKFHWVYYFAILYVAALGLYIVLADVEI